MYPVGDTTSHKSLWTFAGSIEVSQPVSIAENAAGGLPVGLAGGKAGLVLTLVQSSELAQQIAVVKAAQLILLYVLFHVNHLFLLKFLFPVLLLPLGHKGWRDYFRLFLFIALFKKKQAETFSACVSVEWILFQPFSL